MSRIGGISLVVLIAVTLLVNRGTQNQASANTISIDSVAITPWYTELIRDENLSPSAFYLAYEGLQRLVHSNKISNDSLITVIDFSKPSNEERFYIIDIKNGQLIKKSLVAHGKNSGLNYAEKFSNKRYSNMSSLGLFVTSQTYKGKHGYSLRINGVDGDLNDNALKRAVVIHGANYVTKEFATVHGRIGRSFGCPSLPYAISKEVINLIKEGSTLFIYHPSIKFTSRYQQETMN